MTLPAIFDTDRNPSEVAYPAMLPWELALRASSPQEVCKAYGVDAAEWSRLRADPIFQLAVRRAVDELKKDGMTFKLKAHLQSEAYLKTSWDMCQEPHSVVPPAVKADLIKYTMRVAGLDASKDQVGGTNAKVGTALQININL